MTASIKITDGLSLMGYLDETMDELDSGGYYPNYSSTQRNNRKSSKDLSSSENQWELYVSGSSKSKQLKTITPIQWGRTISTGPSTTPSKQTNTLNTRENPFIVDSKPRKSAIRDTFSEVFMTRNRH